MVVPDAPFVARNGPGRLDAPDEANFGEGMERVIHGLMRRLGETFTDSMDDGLGICVRMIAHSLKYRDPLLCHAQGTVPQCCGRMFCMLMLLFSHNNSMPRSFE